MLWNISLLFKVRMEQGVPKMQNAYKKYCYEKKPTVTSLILFT